MTAIADTLWFQQALLPDGWARDMRVTIRDGLIAAIETDAFPEAGDERHAIALPGLPNLHSHAFQRGMAGLAERRGSGSDSFWTWREIMYRFVDRIGPDELEAIAALAYMEMLESGSTRVGEFHYLHHDLDGGAYADRARMASSIAAAAERTGIALTLLPVFYAHSGFGGAAPGAGQRRFLHDIDGFAALMEASRHAVAPLPDAIVGIAPHSLRATTPDELAAILPLAQRGPIHIHIAEQTAEVVDCLAWSGARPVDWLLDHAPVDDRWCLVHATHITDGEARRIAASGAVVGLCPITEANLGDGIFPAAAFTGRFGIGSDSNVLIDATEELRLLEYGQRLIQRERNVLASGPDRSTGADLYRKVLDGGARALGAEMGIATGRSADFVTLDTDHPALIGREGDRLIDSLIFAAGRAAIDCVWRRGARIVADGSHVARESIVADYRAVLGRLLA
ncbi:MAG: formimidoylglutamate deiminase [Sphingomonas bacterium]|nr:formimidoylglutamate deiminase [Sphingomonas bacterium]